MVFAIDLNLDEKERKFRELILYISEQSEGDRTFGAVKLNKLLFYADFLHYAYYGKSITGQEYFKLPHGPAPRRLLPVTNDMEMCGDITYRNREYYGKKQKRLFAKRDPNLDVFSAKELDLVHRVIESFKHTNARDISSESHEFAGWIFAKEKETIPFAVALVGVRKPTETEIKLCKNLSTVARECLSGIRECVPRCEL